MMQKSAADMSAAEIHFAAPYDRAAKIITACACALLVLTAAVSQSLIVAGVSAVIVAVTYAYSPRGYVVSDRFLIVRRWAGAVRIPLESIREARPADGEDLSGAVRWWASGGMFGYFGLYSTSKLGRCPWYVTSRKNAVIVVTGEKTVLVSPGDVEGFLSALGSEASLVEAAAGRGHARRWTASAVAGISIGVLTIAVVLFAFLYSPGTPAYTLTPDRLTIHDRFYPVTLHAAEVDLEQARVVDITSDKNWRPTLRTNGFANCRYRAGWFRVESGKRVRMYRTNETRLVLLPPSGDGAPVLLEVVEPEQFLAELRRQWRSSAREQSPTGRNSFRTGLQSANHGNSSGGLRRLVACSNA